LLFKEAPFRTLSPKGCEPTIFSKIAQQYYNLPGQWRVVSDTSSHQKGPVEIRCFGASFLGIKKPEAQGNDEGLKSYPAIIINRDQDPCVNQSGFHGMSYMKSFPFGIVYFQGLLLFVMSVSGKETSQKKNLQS